MRHQDEHLAAQMIEKYKAWLFEQPHLLSSCRVAPAYGLGCWCTPLLCHARALAELVAKRLEECRPAVVAWALICSGISSPCHTSP
ncbi:DUF4326 domain-containing protein [Pseudonocardia adelaidensis]|uniref:DUF4326 domain-containing protein n=1 Tax=Pseudonocardia adelaidensis TaxID=648754 RepID=UPI003CD0AC79